ncbi:LysR family transcriptional regulator [Sorangium sp. So ce131]|uniref:LysR family transcriptional regulator n=1 Tax=Sorangium sp. So ce131 TaxID=3133282 RepID=UPI003F5DE237
MASGSERRAAQGRRRPAPPPPAARERRDAGQAGALPPAAPARDPEILDDLQSFLVFARAVEARSFTAAARRLRTTTSAVSKRVARLEERLGVSLFERTTRAVAPTEAGSRLYERCARILREVEAAEIELAGLGSAPRGTLRVSAQVTLGDEHVAPLAAAFLARHPEVRLDLVCDDKPVNVVEEGFDLALRVGSGLPDSALVARRLATLRSVVCGSPEYVARRGVPLAPGDLLAHDCLHFGLVSVASYWALRTPAGPLSVPVVPRAHFTTASALRHAALAGLGLVHVPSMVVTEDLRSGKLVSVLDGYTRRDLGIYALYPSARGLAPKVRAFVDFLAERLPPRVELAAAAPSEPVKPRRRARSVKRA